MCKTPLKYISIHTYQNSNSNYLGVVRLQVVFNSSLSQWSDFMQRMHNWRHQIIQNTKFNINPNKNEWMLFTSKSGATMWQEHEVYNSLVPALKLILHFINFFCMGRVEQRAGGDTYINSYFCISYILIFYTMFSIHHSK